MGTIVNVIAVVIGGFIGLLLKNKISRRFMEHITVVLGCAVIIMGIVELIPTMIHFEDGKLTTSHSMILILSLVIGYGAGHWLGLSRLINKFSDYLERKVHREGFAKGFVSASLSVSSKVTLSTLNSCADTDTHARNRKQSHKGIIRFINIH